jgi:(1->4)-alpha-D-glucan 1-alpha-D-glucosylmutase
VAECPPVGEAIEAAVRDVNGEAGRPESFDALHELLEAQAYRLAYWRTASHEINYRRFFDVNELAGLRVEDPRVFAATHALLGDLLASGFVHAVRVDHPDGLFDPAKYFAMLQALGGGDLYVLAEKILSAGEALPRGWRVAGTTGYDYLNELSGLFVARAEAKRMRRAYVKLTGLGEAFEDVRYDCKRLIMETSMASELNVLAPALERIAEGNAGRATLRSTACATRWPRSSPASPSTAPTSTNAAGRRKTAPSSSVRSRAPGGAIRRWRPRSSTSSAR